MFKQRPSGDHWKFHHEWKVDEIIKIIYIYWKWKDSQKYIHMYVCKYIYIFTSLHHWHKKNTINTKQHTNIHKLYNYLQLWNLGFQHFEGKLMYMTFIPLFFLGGGNEIISNSTSRPGGVGSSNSPLSSENMFYHWLVLNSQPIAHLLVI